MITYDSRNWFAALALHRADTFRKLLPLLVAVGAYFVPEERETLITRDVVFQDVRDKAALFGPFFKK